MQAKKERPNDSKEAKKREVSGGKEKYTSLRIHDPDVLLERKNRDSFGNIKLKIERDELDRYFGSSG